MYNTVPTATFLALLSVLSAAKPVARPPTGGELAEALFTPGLSPALFNPNIEWPDRNEINITFTKPTQPSMPNRVSNYWPDSVQKLIDAGTSYIIAAQTNYTGDTLPIYSISTTTQSTNDSTTVGQKEFKFMEIDILPFNSSRTYSFDNGFDDAIPDDSDDNSTSSSTTSSVSTPGNWTGPTRYPLTSSEVATAKTWSLKNKKDWYANMTLAAQLLEKKSLNGPWDFLTISLPKYTPANNYTTLNSNGTIFYEIGNNSAPDADVSTTYIFSQDGKVFKRTQNLTAGNGGF